MPACCVFGCHISKTQVELIHNNFDRIYYLRDHDLAGDELEVTLKQECFRLQCIDKLHELVYPDNYKDIGEVNDYQLLNSLRDSIYN